MGTTLNKEAYQKLIEGDLAVLEQLPHSLEKDHIISVLNDSIDFYYKPRFPEIKNEEEVSLLIKIAKLEADNKVLRFMVDNGLGEEDMFDDITYPHEI